MTSDTLYKAVTALLKAEGLDATLEIAAGDSLYIRIFHPHVKTCTAILIDHPQDSIMVGQRIRRTISIDSKDLADPLYIKKLANQWCR